ncbi:MAG: hypothetical protein IPJ69_11725 [Deltaproteobacteria bacterium]|nr:MAG: hypothetical protein IPJ69_11725 [Deltaproteobacteria bacterium]
MRQKTRKTVLPVAAALLALSAYGITKNVDFGMGEARADATGTMNVSVSCSQKAQEAWVSGVVFTMSLGSASAGTSNTVTAIETLSNAIEGDSADPVTATLNAVGASTGYVALATDMPTYKITGVGCQQAATLDVSAYGDGSDEANFDVAIDSSTADRNTFSAARKVDALTTALPLKLVGATGITSLPITDGADNSAVPDGQIVVKGASAGTLMAQVDVSSAGGSGNEDVKLLMHPY